MAIRQERRKCKISSLPNYLSGSECSHLFCRVHTLVSRGRFPRPFTLGKRKDHILKTTAGLFAICRLLTTSISLLEALQDQDLGLEGTFLNEVLYKNAAFLNLVDPISHDLLMSLARDLQCPKKEYDPWKSSDRICRQLIYHLTPHSKWHRHGLPRRRSQASLKNSLQKKLSPDTMDLSGIPLSTRDVHRLAYYLQNKGEDLSTVDLSFTDLTDEMMCLLLPFLWPLPNLTHLSLNGNRLTRATVKDLTDTMKEASKFPCLAWIDLGNNVDISSMPQPLLVGLRKRLGQHATLPTIYEVLDCEAELSSGAEASQAEEGEGATAGSKSHNFLPQSCER
nr:leucine-rich repeat-containing protein 75B [Zootoca vivipara]